MSFSASGFDTEKKSKQPGWFYPVMVRFIFDVLEGNIKENSDEEKVLKSDLMPHISAELKKKNIPHDFKNKSLKDCILFLLEAVSIHNLPEADKLGLSVNHSKSNSAKRFINAIRQCDFYHLFTEIFKPAMDKTAINKNKEIPDLAKSDLGHAFEERLKLFNSKSEELKTIQYPWNDAGKGVYPLVIKDSIETTKSMIKSFIKNKDSGFDKMAHYEQKLFWAAKKKYIDASAPYQTLSGDNKSILPSQQEIDDHFLAIKKQDKEIQKFFSRRKNAAVQENKQNLSTAKIR